MSLIVGEYDILLDDSVMLVKKWPKELEDNLDYTVIRGNHLRH